MNGLERGKIKQLVFEVFWLLCGEKEPFAEIHEDGSFLGTFEDWTQECWQRERKGTEERLSVNEEEREWWTNEWSRKLSMVGYFPTVWGNRKYPRAFDTLRFLFCEDKGVNEPRFAKHVVVKYHGEGEPWEKLIDDEGLVF